MRFWQENRKIVIFVGVSFFVFVLFLCWSAFPWPFTKNSGNPVVCWPYGSRAILCKTRVDDLLKSKLTVYYPESELKPVRRSTLAEIFREVLEIVGFKPRAAPSSGPPALPEGMKALRDYKKNLNAFEQAVDAQIGDLQAAMDLVTHGPFRVPKSEEDPGWYFMRTRENQKVQLEDLQTRLDEMNKNRDTPIHFDPTLGFNFSQPPSKTKTPFLLVQLSIVRDVIELALRCGMNRVDSVIPGAKCEDKGSADGNFFAEYPIGFNMHGALPALMKFINSLNGVHGEVVVDPNTKFPYVNRGSDDGLEPGERVIISREGKFVATAVVEALENKRARLIAQDPIDGGEGLEPAAGDKVSNHFYVVRKMAVRPSRNPIFESAGLLETQISLAAVQFRTPVAQKEPGFRKPSKRGQPKGEPEPGEGKKKYIHSYTW